MTRRPPPLAPCLLAPILGVIGSFATCTGTHQGGGAGSRGDATTIDASAAGVVRLLDALERATVEASQLGVMKGELGPAAPGDLALADELSPAATSAGAWPGAWFDEKFLGAAIAGLPEAATMPHASMAPEFVDGCTAVRLIAARPDTAGASLSTVVPAAGEETWLVSARMRALAPAPDAKATRPSLAWIPVTSELPRADELAARAAKFAEQWRARPRRAALADDPALPWQELRLVARPYPGRRGLVVSVAGGDCGALVDRVEVRRLTPLEALALSADDSVEPSGNPLRRRVELDHETFDALALPVPGRAGFRVKLPADHPRLEVAFAAKSAGDAPVRLSVRVAGVEKATAIGTARFERTSIDLAAAAGTTVSLELVADGPAGAVALFSAPTLLGAAKSAAAGRPRNVLLISLDTLRADHLGCYGGDATPRLDRLAAEGTRFEQVISPASYTLPTHLSMMSGQDPLVHETVLSTQPMDPARTSMLARRFADAGGRTAAFTGGGLVHPRYGFGVGFDSYSIRDPGGVVGLHRRIGDEPELDAAPGEDRVAPIVDWMARSADVPFFLFVHTYLVHNYRPSQADLDAIAAREPAGAAVDKSRPTREQLELLRQAAAKGEPAALARMRLLYRASIRQADREIVGRLLDALDALRLADSTLVVLVADHGEEFFEHGMLGHGDELWHDLTRVPWILRGPGVARGLVRGDPVALSDVAPTVAALVGLPADARVLAQDQLATDPEDNLDGPFAPKLLSLRRLADRPEQDAIVLWPWKLVQRRAAAPAGPFSPAEPLPFDPPAQLFDLASDPGETRDLAAAEPRRVAGLTRLLEGKLEAAAKSVRALPSSKGERRFELPPELERMLDQLGYARDER